MGDAGLWYVRTFDGREADFLIELNGKPALAIEAAWADTSISAGLRNLAARLGTPIVQVVHTAGILRVENGTAVVSGDRLLRVLP
ncbi:MAG: hypothetical protein AAB368_13390 [bacterium]|mgnify:FL=1